MNSEWMDEVEKRTDGIVEKVVEEMKSVAEDLLTPSQIGSGNILRGIVLASIVWTNLGRKIARKLDDIRHEHLLAMRSCVEESEKP